MQQIFPVLSHENLLRMSQRHAAAADAPSKKSHCLMAVAWGHP
jgi:hypothetical protein